MLFWQFLGQAVTFLNKASLFYACSKGGVHMVKNTLVGTGQPVHIAGSVKGRVKWLAPGTANDQPGLGAYQVRRQVVRVTGMALCPTLFYQFAKQQCAYVCHKAVVAHQHFIDLPPAGDVLVFKKYGLRKVGIRVQPL